MNVVLGTAKQNLDLRVSHLIYKARNAGSPSRGVHSQMPWRAINISK